MLEGWNYQTMKDICNVNQGLQINISQREKHKRINNKLLVRKSPRVSLIWDCSAY